MAENKTKTTEVDKKKEPSSAPSDAKAIDGKKATEDKEKKQEERKIPEIKSGMTVRVYQKIQEKNPKGELKERIQYFEGLVIAVKHGKEAGASITVRKTSDGVGVEKIFPIHLPTITKIEIKKQSRVRRAKLNFLKDPKKRYKKKLKNVPLTPVK